MARHRDSSGRKAADLAYARDASVCPRPEKIVYATKQAAKQAITRMRHQGHVHAYRCDCGGWHVGGK